MNPQFVLRQWLLEEVIAKVKMDSDNRKRLLAKVLHVSLGFIFFTVVLDTQVLYRLLATHSNLGEQSVEGIDAEVREEQ